MIRGWVRTAPQVEEGRHYIDQMGGAIDDFAVQFRRDAFGPVGNKRRSNAAFAGVVFLEPERRIVDLGPALPQKHG